MTCDFRLANVGQRGRLPSRFVVFVDDHSAHALIEIMAVDDARHYAHFGAHARIEIGGCAVPHLRQREFKTERRFSPHGGGGLSRPFGIAAARRRFAVDPGKNAFDGVAGTAARGGAIAGGFVAGEIAARGLLRLRGDAPYACQGGVCGTCRARLVEGEVTMAATWALEPDELARGDVLTCQARAESAHLVLDFEG